MLRVSSRSTASTVLPSDRPMRLDTLKTCVSTAMTGLSYIIDATTLAVLRPTPGSLTNWSGSEGTMELKSSESILAIPIRCLALLLGKVMDLIRSKTSSKLAAARSFGSGYCLNISGVCILTLLSVHWADKMTAINRWNGVS